MYAVLFLSAAPGLPLGFVLFGRRHAGGWIAGALLGYAASCLVVWLAVFTHHASTLVFSLLWLTAVILSIGVSRVVPLRGRPALVALPAWTSRDLLFSWSCCCSCSSVDRSPASAASTRTATNVIGRTSPPISSGTPRSPPNFAGTTSLRSTHTLRRSRFTTTGPTSWCPPLRDRWPAPTSNSR